MDVNLVSLLECWINIYNCIKFTHNFYFQLPLSTIFNPLISPFHIILPHNFHFQHTPPPPHILDFERL